MLYYKAPKKKPMFGDAGYKVRYVTQNEISQMAIKKAKSRKLKAKPQPSYPMLV